jgi:membrane protease YdiL (CAAX protease family)
VTIENTTFMTVTKKDQVIAILGPIFSAIGYYLLASVIAVLSGILARYIVAASADAAATSKQILVIQASSFATVLGMAISFGLTALWKGRQVDQTNIAAGLGWKKIGRIPVVLVLAVAICGYAVVVGVMFHLYRPNPLVPVLLANRVLWFLSSATLVVALPMAEEVFFRGWLWLAIERQSSAITAAALTAVLWLAAHLEQGVTAAAVLAPAAAALSAARYYGQSVLASMLLHVTYNCVMVVLPVLLAHSSNGLTQ